MNSAHLHLILSHFPVSALPFGVLFLCLSAAFKKPDFQNAARILFVLAAVTIVPLYLAGEGAERVLSTVAQVSEDKIGPHESAAKWAMALTVALGLVSLVGLLDRGKKIAPKAISLALIALSVLSLLAVLRTANFGGHIRHSEISVAQPAEADGDKD